ncbi:hypothetical protein ACRALDRAFT_211711 [Sodiomyces alcalophilus JCM 7366]|uniref:uncharacterized protein n=1 Tax=Sodiomyces alcalophilus JCM 7366 TaxID=591952 RepID=UPI0039B6335A
MEIASMSALTKMREHRIQNELRMHQLVFRQPLTSISSTSLFFPLSLATARFCGFIGIKGAAVASSPGPSHWCSIQPLNLLRRSSTIRPASNYLLLLRRLSDHVATQWFVSPRETGLTQPHRDGLAEHLPTQNTALLQLSTATQLLRSRMYVGVYNVHVLFPTYPAHGTKCVQPLRPLLLAYLGVSLHAASIASTSQNDSPPITNFYELLRTLSWHYTCRYPADGSCFPNDTTNGPAYACLLAWSCKYICSTVLPHNNQLALCRTKAEGVELHHFAPSPLPGATRKRYITHYTRVTANRRHSYCLEAVPIVPSTCHEESLDASYTHHLPPPRYNDSISNYQVIFAVDQLTPRGIGRNQPPENAILAVPTLSVVRDPPRKRDSLTVPRHNGDQFRNHQEPTHSFVFLSMAPIFASKKYMSFQTPFLSSPWIE